MALGRAIDDGVVAANAAALASWLTLVALAYVVRAVAQTVRMQTNVGAGLAEHDLRVQALDRITAPGGIGGTSRLPGDLLAVVVTDVRAVSRAFIALTSIPGNAVTLLGSLVAMALINGWLALATVCIVPLLILLSVKGVAPVKRSTRRERRAEAAVAGSAADLTSGLRVIQGLSAEHRATERFRAASREGLAATLRNRRIKGVYTGTINASVGVFITALTVLAGWLALTGHISVGQLVTVVGLAQTLGPPLRALGVDTATMLSSANASGDRLCELRDSPAAWPVHPDDGARTTPGDGPVWLRVSVWTSRPGHTWGSSPRSKSATHWLTPSTTGRKPCSTGCRPVVSTRPSDVVWSWWLHAPRNSSTTPRGPTSCWIARRRLPNSMLSSTPPPWTPSRKRCRAVWRPRSGRADAMSPEVSVSAWPWREPCCTPLTVWC